MKKRILIFSTAYRPLIGGAEVAVEEITKRLTDDYEFDLITARLDRKLKKIDHIDKVNVYRVGIGFPIVDKLLLAFFGHRLAIRLQKDRSYELVWSVMASFAGLAATLFKKRLPRIPFLLTLQEGDSMGHIFSRAIFVWPWFKQIFKKADKIQAISNYLAQWAKDMGAQCPIEVVPNGVDFNLFQLLPNSYTRSGKVVITTSRLVPKNGLSDLIKAMKYLDSSVKVRIIGSGYLEQQLKKQASALGERVEFLGEKDHHEISRELRDSDVFCRPSISEGLGNSFLEAMYAGVPVVGTNVGGIPDFLKDGETGLFCKVNDPEDIARQIKRIFDDNALAEKLRTNGRKLVAENYSWDKIANQMKNIFNSLCVS